MNITDAQSDYVERVGRFWESLSMGRTAGRILGWLMICDPPHQSAAGLRTNLGASAGSISTQVRLLEQLGLVERVTFSGSRASFYQLPDHVWSRSMDTELVRIVQMRALAEAGSAVIPNIRPERVTELEEVAKFFAAEWPGLLERLHQRVEVRP
ncbi:MAG: MarR family transcriptional regulator [Acidimicrobiia bacterium]|nr:MarR family transcriptional regulator [Acidimicrobiia bacterium]